MPQTSSQNQNTVNTPVARQPKFPCPHCTRRCFNSAGLKNHLRAKHSSLSQESTSSSDRSSPVSATGSVHLRLSDSSPDILDDEEELEHPMDVDFDDVQPEPAFQVPNDDEYDDHGYNSEFDMNQHDHTGNSPSSDSESEFNLIIPSSPGPLAQPEHHNVHQQTPANDRFLRRVYHDKLNGELTKHFC